MSTTNNTDQDQLVSWHFIGETTLPHPKLYKLIETFFGQNLMEPHGNQSSRSKGISETNLKLYNPSSICMHRPVTSRGNACSTCHRDTFGLCCMHWLVMSQANHMVAACTNCMGFKVSSLSRIYLYSSYFAWKHFLFQYNVMRKDSSFSAFKTRVDLKVEMSIANICIDINLRQYVWPIRISQFFP